MVNMTIGYEWVPTADLIARSQCSYHPAVQLHRGLLHHPLLRMTLIHTLFDPGLERITHQGVDDIPNVVPW